MLTTEYYNLSKLAIDGNVNVISNPISSLSESVKLARSLFNVCANTGMEIAIRISRIVCDQQYDVFVINKHGEHWFN